MKMLLIRPKSLAIEQPTPPRSPIPFRPVCPPPPRVPSPLALDGLSLGGRPPGLDAPSESTLQTEISESLSDALR